MGSSKLYPLEITKSCKLFIVVNSAHSQQVGMAKNPSVRVIQVNEMHQCTGLIKLCNQLTWVKTEVWSGDANLKNIREIR